VDGGLQKFGKRPERVDNAFKKRHECLNAYNKRPERLNNAYEKSHKCLNNAGNVLNAYKMSMKNVLNALIQP